MIGGKSIFKSHERAAAGLFCSAFFMVAMGVQIKALTTLVPIEQRLSDLQVMCARFVFGLLVVLVVAAWGHVRFKTERGGGLLLRSLLGTLTTAFYYYALAHGELTRVTLIGYSFIIFGTLFSFLWLNEKPRLDALGALAVAVCGLVVLLRPDLQGASVADMAALGSAITGGLVVTTVRDLRRTESAALIYFSLCLFGAMLTGLGLLLTALGVVPLPPTRVPQGLGVALLLGICIASAGGQLLLVWGMRYASTLLGSLISLATVPLSALAGVLLFGERLYFHTLLGGFLVLAAAMYLSVGRRSES
jgi:drug/metabolite transporter (DMT)-like permease